VHETVALSTGSTCNKFSGCDRTLSTRHSSEIVSNQLAKSSLGLPLVVVVEAKQNNFIEARVNAELS
jgi:hypothetical protein